MSQEQIHASQLFKEKQAYMYLKLQQIWPCLNEKFQGCQPVVDTWQYTNEVKNDVFEYLCVILVACIKLLPRYATYNNG